MSYIRVSDIAERQISCTENGTGFYRDPRRLSRARGPPVEKKGAALCLMQSPLHSVREGARSLRFLNVCEPRILAGALGRACFREIRVGVQVYEITHAKDEFSRCKIRYIRYNDISRTVYHCVC